MPSAVYTAIAIIFIAEIFKEWLGLRPIAF
jgi:hypothetical protein